VEVYCPGGGNDVVKILVGNKIDKVVLFQWWQSNLFIFALQERFVSRQDADEWARSKGMIFIECSAKTTTGIEEVFQEVVEKVRLLISN
jgi:Ras-related protein Rab-18